MPTMPKSLFWTRVDLPGAEHALVDDRSALLARGTALAAGPVGYTCRYEIRTDTAWASVYAEVSCEGAGWLRTLRLERAAGRWRIGTAERGDLDRLLTSAGLAGAGLPGTEDPGRLDAALDLDLGGSPLTNTLPIRRLGLLDAPPGTTRTITVAWVLVPSLTVLAAEQCYTVRAPGKIQYTSGDFTADLDVDPEGYLVRYPGLAERATGRA
jgi:hypothetical protein